MRMLLCVCLLVLAASLAGCANQATAAREAVKTAEVSMPPTYRFAPAAIQVDAGTTVTWRNADNFTHSVRVLNGSLPFLDLKPGASGSITFEEPGEYDYICTYHAQDMKGKVIVAVP